MGVTRVRLLRWVGVAAAMVATVICIGWFSPLFAVRSITVEGNGAIPEADILSAAEIRDDTPLLRVDTAAAAARIARIPRVARGRVQVRFPSRIHISVVERVPTLFFDSARGAHLMDGTGIEYLIGPIPRGVPRLQTPHPGAGDPATQVALSVLVATSPALRAQIADITVRTVSNVVLTLRDGRIVKWGGKTDSERKAAVTPPLLSRPGHIYDVSSPDLPTVR